MSAADCILQGTTLSVLDLVGLATSLHIDTHGKTPRQLCDAINGKVALEQPNFEIEGIAKDQVPTYNKRLGFTTIKIQYKYLSGTTTVKAIKHLYVEKTKGKRNKDGKILVYWRGFPANPTLESADAVEAQLRTQRDAEMEQARVTAETEAKERVAVAEKRAAAEKEAAAKEAAAKEAREAAAKEAAAKEAAAREATAEKEAREAAPKEANTKAAERAAQTIVGLPSLISKSGKSVEQSLQEMALVFEASDYAKELERKQRQLAKTPAKWQEFLQAELTRVGSAKPHLTSVLVEYGAKELKALQESKQEQDAKEKEAQKSKRFHIKVIMGDDDE